MLQGFVAVWIYLTTIYTLESCMFLVTSWHGEAINDLCAFFWVISRRLNFICQRFGTLCLFYLHRPVGMKKWPVLFLSRTKIFVYCCFSTEVRNILLDVRTVVYISGMYTPKKRFRSNYFQCNITNSCAELAFWVPIWNK